MTAELQYESHIEQAILFYQEVCHQNILLSEQKIIDKILSSTSEEKYLLERLYSRAQNIFRLDSIEYFTSETQASLLDNLANKELIWLNPPWLSRKRLLELHTVEELKQYCKTHKLRRSGKKHALIERLLETHHSFTISVLILRNHELLLRIISFYLRDHRGNINTLLLQKMGIQSFSFVPFSISTAFPLHKTRTEYKDYRKHQKESTSLSEVPIRLPLQKEQFRFSGMRFFQQRCIAQARLLEKTNLAQAISLYQQLEQSFSLFQAPELQTDLYQRYALCLHRNNEGKKALSLLKKALEKDIGLANHYTLIKTGRQIAKRYQQGFPLLPVLKEPLFRSLFLGESEKKNNRMYYQGLVVEKAIIQFLESHQRIAIWSENGFWRMAFSVLLYPAMFSPIDGMLPVSTMFAPADFMTEEFYLRRKPQIEEIITQIAHDQLEEILSQREPITQYTIQGLDLQRYPWERFSTLLLQIPTHVIIAVLRILLEFPKSAYRGLPDLFIIGGPKFRSDKCFPRSVSSDFFFAEIKSPNDVVSTHQKIWFHHLIRYDVRVEIWKLTNG